MTTFAEFSYNVNLPIIFTTGTGSGTERMRIHTGGNVGIGANNPNTKLEVAGIIKAGDLNATAGGVFVTGKYGDNLMPNIFGAMYSSAFTLIGYGVRSHASNSNTFLSTADNAAWSRGALQVGSNLIFSNAGAQTTAVGSNVTMTERFRVAANGNVGMGATVITSADASNAFIVKTNHSGNPTALQIGGNGAINGVASSAQSFTILNVAKDSGSGNSAYFHGNVKTAGVYNTTHTSSVGHETSINILNNDPVDGGSDFDQDPTNNVDGGGTTWSISGSGDAIYFENTSGGHGGTWMKVNVEAGYYVIKGTVRLTNTDQTDIHSSTSSANYKYTHSFRFEISGGPDTGHLKWDADAIATANGTDFTRAGFCSGPVYMAAGNKNIVYNTNGYNGVQQIYITNLELVRIG